MIIISKPILTTILKQSFKFSSSQSNQIIRSYSNNKIVFGFINNNNNDNNKQISSFSALNNSNNIKGVLFFKIPSSRQFSTTSSSNNKNDNKDDKNLKNTEKNDVEKKDIEKKEEAEDHPSEEEASSIRNRRKDKFAGMFSGKTDISEVVAEIKGKDYKKYEEEIIKEVSQEPEKIEREQQQQQEEQQKKDSEKVVIVGDHTTHAIYSIFAVLFFGTIGVALTKLIKNWNNGTSSGVLGIQQFDFILLIQDIYFGDLKPAMEEGNPEFDRITRKNYFFDEAGVLFFFFKIRHTAIGDTITLIIPILQKKTHAKLGHVNVDFCKEGNEMTVQNFYINGINGGVYELSAPKQKIDTSKERYSGKYSLEELLADPTL